jgi:phosphoribosylanthranilate isomerase
MKIKVCGLKDISNMKEIEAIQPDLMGFIFVPNSPRYIGLSEEKVRAIRSLKGKKVGVFVNPDLHDLLKTMELFNLDIVQLHGDESAEFVKEVSQFYPVIKAFSIDDSTTFQFDEYEAATYFLFDAKGIYKGGNGEKFNWELLNRYSGAIPFLLSGGIRLSDVDLVKEIKHPKLMGIDVNSGFENAPGEKNVIQLQHLLKQFSYVYD